MFCRVAVISFFFSFAERATDLWVASGRGEELGEGEGRETVERDGEREREREREGGRECV